MIAGIATSLIILSATGGTATDGQNTGGEYGGSESGQETTGESGGQETDPPDHIEYYTTGEIDSERWYLNNQLNQENQLHRENDKPAVIHYDENGEIERESWHLNGEFIRSEPSQ